MANQLEGSTDSRRGAASERSGAIDDCRNISPSRTNASFSSPVGTARFASKASIATTARRESAPDGMVKPLLTDELGCRPCATRMNRHGREMSIASLGYSAQSSHQIGQAESRKKFWNFKI